MHSENHIDHRDVPVQVGQIKDNECTFTRCNSVNIVLPTFRKKGLLLKERIRSLWEQILTF